MLKIVTAHEMQAIDQSAIKNYQLPGLVLMENAGRGVASLMHRKITDLNTKKVMVIAGTGNNGGDGFVIARHLHNSGVKVEILLLGKRSQLKSDARTNADIAFKMKLPIHEVSENNFNSKNHSLRHCHVIVDAIFGTGLSKPAGGLFQKAIKKINSAGKFVVAVDIPSGIDSDSGQWLGPHVQAQLTAALGLMKRSHLLYPAAEAMGDVEVLDISIPSQAVASQKIKIELLEKSDIQAWLPKRKPNTHKGNYGHTLVVGGSRGKGGAAGLAALAALKVGAGLVTLAVPESCHHSLEFNPLETMSVPLPETKSGRLALQALDTLIEHTQGKSSLAIGPGLATEAATVDLLRLYLPQVECPMVIDADGLNCLSQGKEILSELQGPVILTPHPKEFSRLSDSPVKKILERRLEAVADFAQTHSLTLLLKGAGTLIAHPDGHVWINPTGNPGMATAGSGDVLTGIIAGLLAQGLEPQPATGAGAYLHGLAGDLYAEQYGEASLIGGDLITKLPESIQKVLTAL